MSSHRACAGNEHGEAHHLAALGLLARIRGPSALLRRLRAAPARFRKALGPIAPPKAITVRPEHWLVTCPNNDVPWRRRECQWRVVFRSKIVARTRPTTSAPVVSVFEPGALLWSERPRDDGWVVLADAHYERRFVLIDATSLGLAKLLERVEPPELEEGACGACRSARCYCDLLKEYAR